MKKNLFTASKTIVFAVATSILLSACNSINNALPSNSQSTDAMMGNGTNAGEITFSPDEIMFLQMMIPHHEQAVVIANTAATQTKNPAVLDLASRISGAQQPEIDLMKKLLTAAGMPLMMDHSMGMNGMLPDSDLKELSQVKDEAYDKLFLSAMIRHHEGAIVMTSPMLDSSNSELKILAKNITSSQSAEIEEMKALLALP